MTDVNTEYSVGYNGLIIKTTNGAVVAARAGATDVCNAVNAR